VVTANKMRIEIPIAAGLIMVCSPSQKGRPVAQHSQLFQNNSRF
jgi:hypothetical protein